MIVNLGVLPKRGTIAIWCAAEAGTHYVLAACADRKRLAMERRMVCASCGRRFVVKVNAYAGREG